MLTEQEMLQKLKDYIMNSCVGIIDINTNKTLKSGTLKNKIGIGLNKIKAQHQEFTAHKIGELFEQAIIELLENGNIIDGKFIFYHRFNE